jgi:hypothetical protein
MLADVLQVYYKHQKLPGSDLVMRKGFEFLSSGKNPAVIEPSKWGDLVVPGSTIEMRMVRKKYITVLSRWGRSKILPITVGCMWTFRLALNFRLGKIIQGGMWEPEMRFIDVEELTRDPSMNDPKLDPHDATQNSLSTQLAHVNIDQVYKEHDQMQSEAKMFRLYSGIWEGCYLLWYGVSASRCLEGFPMPTEISPSDKYIGQVVSDERGVEWREGTHELRNSMGEKAFLRIRDLYPFRSAKHL